MSEYVIVILYPEGYVSHGVGESTLRVVPFPQEKFHPGWGGAKWCKDRGEWVIPPEPSRKVRQRNPETRWISYS